MLLLILGLILFISLVVVHELGHFWVARRNGVVAEEFGIFFPPTLWRKKMKSGFDFTINALPLGGFVKLKGEHDSDKTKGSFGAASDWAKTKIMLAGVAVNLAVAVLLLFGLSLFGIPKLIDNQFTVASDTKIVSQNTFVAQVTSGSPADKAGLKQQDKLLTLTDSAGVTTDLSGADLSSVTKAHAGQTVTIKYDSAGSVKTSKVTLLNEKTVAASLKTDDPKGYLGVAPFPLTIQRSTWSAPVVALGLTAQFTKITFQGLGQAVKGLGGIIAGTVTGNSTARQHAQTEASSQVSGPLGIYFVLKSGSMLGLTYTLTIIALISLTLAIMNVLPIPALDGGRLYMMLLSRLTKEKRLSQKMEESIVGWSFIALIGLIIIITIVDVKRFF